MWTVTLNNREYRTTDTAEAVRFCKCFGGGKMTFKSSSIKDLKLTAV